MALDYGTGGPISVSMEGPISGGGGTALKFTNITILAENWKGGESPYYQVVEVAGVSVNSIVNLNPSVDEMARFHNQYIEFTVKNNGGIVTLYAIGDMPAADCVFQATLIDVVNIGEGDGSEIWGNTVCTPMVRTNWEQTNPDKADYLKGRDALEMLIQTAQTTANDNKDEIEKLKNDKAETDTYKCILVTGGWSDAAPYTQTVFVDGLLSTDYPFVDIDLSEVADAQSVIEGWNMVGRLTVSGDNSIIAYCYEEAPAVDIPIVFKVVR